MLLPAIEECDRVIAAAPKPMIRICGTKGAIIAAHGSVTIHQVDEERNKIETAVPMEPHGHKKYYQNIRDHIVKGTPLIITPEWARRVIQVLQYACLSAKLGKPLKAKYK